jgi:hypothetical protein
MDIGWKDSSEFIFYKDEPNLNDKSLPGVGQNRIVEITNFISTDQSEGLIKYFNNYSDDWGRMDFLGLWDIKPRMDDEELEKYGLEPGFFQKLVERCQEAVSDIFGASVIPTTIHGQRWEPGGFAVPHSDSSDLDGNPTPFKTNKYVGILYLTDDYVGGELYFPEHGIEIKSKANSFCVFPGGIENVHGVKEVISGTRHTMISFWDFASAEYSKEEKRHIDEEALRIIKNRDNIRLSWDNGDDDSISSLQYITRSRRSSGKGHQ